MKRDAAQYAVEAKDATALLAVQAQVRQSSFQPGASKGGTFVCEVTEVLPLDLYESQRYRLKVLNAQTKTDSGLFIEAAVIAEDNDTTMSVGERVAVTLTSSHSALILTGRPTDSRGDGFPVEAFSWLNDVDVSES